MQPPSLSTPSSASLLHSQNEAQVCLEGIIIQWGEDNQICVVCCLLLEMPAEAEDLLEASRSSGSGPCAGEEHGTPSQTAGDEGLAWVSEPVCT